MVQLLCVLLNLGSRNMNLRKIASVTLAVVGMVTAGVLVPSPAFAIDNGPWEIYSAHSGKCVEVAGGSTASSAQVQQWACGSDDGSVTPLHQRWIFRDTDSGYYRLVNGKSKLCANIQGSTDTNSTKIVQYKCGSDQTLNDQWFPNPEGTDSGTDIYTFHSRLNYNKCLNVQGGGTSNGTDLILYTCSKGGPNDYFSWTPARQA